MIDVPFPFTYNVSLLSFYRTPSIFQSIPSEFFISGKLVTNQSFQKPLLLNSVYVKLTTSRCSDRVVSSLQNGHLPPVLLRSYFGTRDPDPSLRVRARLSHSTDPFWNEISLSKLEIILQISGDSGLTGL